jgi:predicted GIY-YIG superfamily endonuclease
VSTFHDECIPHCSTPELSDLIKAVSEHHKIIPASPASTMTKLVYYEDHLTINDAIAREKQIKGGSRQRRSIDQYESDWTFVQYSLSSLHDPGILHGCRKEVIFAPAGRAVGKNTLLAMTDAFRLTNAI